MQLLITTKYRVTINKEIRKKINIKPGQRISFEVVGEQIIMSPVKILA